MSQQPNHYEALGLPPSATAEQIKRRYRELARRYHPDVNPAPDAAAKILIVNLAYQVLGDADRRAAYDAERTMRQMPAPQSRPTSPPASAPRTRRPATQGPDARGRVYYDGFGRAYSSPRPERRPPSGGTAPRGASGAREASIEAALTEAKLAFINRQFLQAHKLCQDVLRINPHEATAHEIMGDIYVRKGDTARASAAFAYAIQFNPRNHSAQVKLERLMHAPSSVPRGQGPTITYTRYADPSAHVEPTSDAAIALVTLLAGGLLLASPVLLSLYPGSPVADGIAATGLTFNLMAALGVGGLAAGVLLALYGRMRPVTRELWSGLGEDGTGPRLPLALLLGGSSLLWFYGSLLLYIGIATVRNRFSPSILRAYAVTLGLVFVFALAYRPAGVSVAGGMAALLAGNFAFPGVLAGWLLGDLVRLRGRT